MPEVKIVKTIRAKLKNRRIVVRLGEDGTFFFDFVLYAPELINGERKRDCVRRSKIALSDEAVAIIAEIYLEVGTGYIGLFNNAEPDAQKG